MVAVETLLSGLAGAPGQERVNQNLARGYAAGAGDDDIDVVLDGCRVAHAHMNGGIRLP